MWSAFDDPVADANNDDNVTSNPSVIDANNLEDDACSTSSTTSSSTADDAPDGDALGGEPMSPKSHLRKPPGATSLFAARSAPDDVWFDPSLNQRVARRVMRKISTMVFSKQRLHDTTDEDFTSSGPTTPQLPVGGVGGDGGRVGSTSGTGTGTGTAPSNAVTATPSLASPTLSADLNSSSTRDTLDPWSTAPNDDSSQVDRGSSSSLGQSATVRGASFGASSSLPLIPKELRARSKRPKGSDIRHLASGGNGSVYLAAVGKQAVVVKVTSYEDAMRESSVLRRLATLPNIIRLLGFSCKPHRASMVVLEYGEGGSLREHASLLRMTIGEARWAAERESVARPLIRQMVVAVCELHARGIVHFDLKCGNFVLSRDRSVAKLIDFGTCRMTASSPMRRVSACDIRSVQASPNVIARTALSNVTPTVQPSNVPVVCAAHWLDSDNDDDNDAAAAAAAGGGAEGHDGDVDGHDDDADSPVVMIEQTLGSVLWMAPEVLTGKATSVKPSADIWSLGCAIIELLQGGETPWCEAFASPHSALWAIGISKCAPSNLPRDVSPACSDFFEMCFQQQESARATARALLAHPFVAGTSTASTCDDASSSNSRSNAVGGSEVGTGRSSHGELFGGDCDEYEHPAPVTPTVTLTRVVGDGGGGGDARQGSSARTPSSSQGGGGGSQGRNRFTVTSTTTTPRSPLLSIGAGRRVASVPRFADPVPSPAQDVAADTHAAGQGSH